MVMLAEELTVERLTKMRDAELFDHDVRLDRLRLKMARTMDARRAAKGNANAALRTLKMRGYSEGLRLMYREKMREYRAIKADWQSLEADALRCMDSIRTVKSAYASDMRWAANR